MDILTISDLPHLHAGLNAITLVLLLLGYAFIRNNQRGKHMLCMLGATLVSSLFMLSYLTYHAKVGYLPFTGQGFVRPVYFSILITHVILAAVIIPLVLTTLVLAARKKFKLHRRLARWTLPIWIYVSITGLVVYFLAFHLYPSPL
ncbi:MAG: DUF420 domain-containing protein [Xanthomonadales bacterium]|nr:DUF420 domain-containing protein [Xanthomonadales bacterium]